MAGDDLMAAAKMAGVAGGAGGVARVLVALQGGPRGWQVLLDFALGGLLGIMAAGGLVYLDPEMRDLGWPMLIVAAAAGCSGAIGTRILDIIIAAAQRRLGG
jgi:hypothetical protein